MVLFRQHSIKRNECVKFSFCSHCTIRLRLSRLLVCIHQLVFIQETLFRELFILFGIENRFRERYISASFLHAICFFSTYPSRYNNLYTLNLFNSIVRLHCVNMNHALIIEVVNDFACFIERIFFFMQKEPFF